MESNDNIIEMGTKGTREEAFKRKAELIKEIVIDSSMDVLEDKRTYQTAAGIGLYQGLKYKGSLTQGLKGGIATLAVIVGSNAIWNIVHHIEDIKKK